jgi:hypothetical protein
MYPCFIHIQKFAPRISARHRFPIQSLNALPGGIGCALPLPAPPACALFVSVLFKLLIENDLHL